MKILLEVDTDKNIITWINSKDSQFDKLTHGEMQDIEARISLSFEVNCLTPNHNEIPLQWQND